MRFVWDILYGLVGVVTSPVWGFAMWRTGKWRTDWAGKFGRVTGLPKKGKKRVLLHAVSVGEVNLIRGLVERLLGEDLEVVVSVTTNTGHARAMALYGEACGVVRYPLDFSFAVGRFLRMVEPDVVGLVELEVWPNFVDACVKRGVPVAVLNGRLSERSFGKYCKLRGVLRPTFAKLSQVAAQDAAYAERFKAMGVIEDRVVVLDSMKWDGLLGQVDVEGGQEVLRTMGVDLAKPVVVLGSTGDGEEAMLVEAMREKITEEGWQVVVVPRKPERFEGVARELDQRGYEVVRWSADEASVDETKHRVFLLDGMGKLKSVYAAADVIVVGRSFNGWGGSDPIEAIAAGASGKPVVMGPATQNFTDAVRAMREAGGMVLVDTPEAAVMQVADWLADPAAAAKVAAAGLQVIQQREGATERHAVMLMQLL